MPKFSKH
jgi:hypothetical protein